MSDFKRSRLLMAVKLFNEASYFEAHEILEDIWYDTKGKGSDFYQGLLHSAVSFYHLQSKNNIKGSLLQINKALNKLKSYNGEYSGINITEFKDKIIFVKKKLEKNIKPKRLPKIQHTNT